MVVSSPYLHVRRSQERSQNYKQTVYIKDTHAKWFWDDGTFIALDTSILVLKISKQHDYTTPKQPILLTIINEAFG